MEMKPFERCDWDCYAGAEAWPDGSLPLILRSTFDDGSEFEVVLDPTGGCFIIDDEQAEAGGYCIQMPFPTQAAALAFAKGIGDPGHRLDLFLLGFKPA